MHMVRRPIHVIVSFWPFARAYDGPEDDEIFDYYDFSCFSLFFEKSEMSQRMGLILAGLLSSRW